MTDTITGYRVSWKDFRDRKSKVILEEFPTKEDADKRKETLKATGLMACVTPIYLKTRRV